MKKITVWLLILSLLLGTVPALAAEKSSDSELLQLQINFDGYLHTAQVMKDKDGTLLAPLEWMTFYGGLQSDTDGGVTTYYKPSQATDGNFAKRWYVIPSEKTYVVGWYFDASMFAFFVSRSKDCSLSEAMKLLTLKEDAMKVALDEYFSQRNTAVERMGTNIMPIHKGTFSKMISYGDDYWVPMSELMAMLELNAGVESSGRVLHISSTQQTLFDVLYEHHEEIEDLLFDSDDVVGNDFMAYSGMVVATCSGELYNVVPVLGKEMDYKEIFTSYLQDNETYLSTFNAESNTKIKYYKDVASSFKGAKTIYASLAGNASPLYEALLKEATDPDYYKKFFSPAKKACKAVDIAASAMEYVNAFANQVEDHQRMLDAVYEYKAKHNWPSYLAAQEIDVMYESEAGLAIAGTVDMTRKMTLEELGENIYKKAYGGWYYAMEITKVVCKDDYEYVINSSKINLVSNTVQYSYEIFCDRLYDRQFNEEGMDNIRLCLMMSLVGSRHAYNTYYKGGWKKEEKEKLDVILTKLYQVGTTRQENNKDLCKTRLKKYSESFKKLRPVYSDPVSIAETNMLLLCLNNEKWQDNSWCVEDLDNDLREEVSFLTEMDKKITKTTVDINEQKVTVVPADSKEILRYNGAKAVPDALTVFGDANAHLASLDNHFAERKGLLGSLKTDLNGDGLTDRVYALRNAGSYWDQDSANALNFPEDNLCILLAQAQEDGILLRFFFDEKFTTALGNELTFEDGNLLVGGCAYSYQKEGTPLKKEGIVRLMSLYSYLSGEINPLEQANVSVSYPNKDDRRKMELIVDDVKLDVFAEQSAIYEIKVTPQKKPVPIIGKLTTDNSAKEIIQGLSLVYWDDYSNVPIKDNISAVMGPYPVMGVEEETYECSVLWTMPDGEIYQLVMQLKEESLDASPYSIQVINLKKPKVAVYELLMRSPEEVAALLSGYTQNVNSSGDTIYGKGKIADSSVEVRFHQGEKGFRAEYVEIRFGESTIDVFQGLDSKASAQEAKEFLQPHFDWDLKDSETVDGVDLYYSTNFYYHKEAKQFYFTTMITGYTWTPEDGYSEGIFSGIQLMYSGEEKDSDYEWYWKLINN